MELIHRLTLTSFILTTIESKTRLIHHNPFDVDVISYTCHELMDGLPHDDVI